MNLNKNAKLSLAGEGILMSMFALFVIFLVHTGVSLAFNPHSTVPSIITLMFYGTEVVLGTFMVFASKQENKNIFYFTGILIGTVLMSYFYEIFCLIPTFELINKTVFVILFLFGASIGKFLEFKTYKD